MPQLHDSYGCYAVISSQECMPTTCPYPYRRLAIVQTTTPGIVPRMISPRARGVVRIISDRRRLNVGQGKRSAFTTALQAAIRDAAKLGKE